MRGRNVWEWVLPFHLAQPAQRFAQDFTFRRDLRCVWKMLVLAAAAAAEVGAQRFDALARGLQNPQRARVHHAFLPANFFHFGALAGQNPRRQNRASGMEAQRLAAVNQLDR